MSRCLADLIPDMLFINDRTIVKIRLSSGLCVASGNWFQDQILDYINHDIAFFVYNPDDNVLQVSVRGDVVI